MSTRLRLSWWSLSGVIDVFPVDFRALIFSAFLRSYSSNVLAVGMKPLKKIVMKRPRFHVIRFEFCRE